MRTFAKRGAIIVLGLTLPGLFAAQAMAVSSIRNNRSSAAPFMRPARPVYLPADDPHVSHAPRVVHKAKTHRRVYKPAPLDPWMPHDRADGTNPDELNAHGLLIEVSIEHQRLVAWQDGRVVMTFIISTGRPGYATPTGHYRIISKSKNAWSSKWGVWMPWAMNWYGNYFIHQLPHYPNSSTNIGESQLGRPASHGCVRVGVGNAEALYHWASVRTPVWVH